MSTTVYYSSSYSHTAVTSHRHRADKSPAHETAVRYANAALALGKCVLQDSAHLAGSSARFLGRHREGAAALAGTASGLAATYYAYKGLGSYDIGAHLNQTIDYYLGTTNHAPSAGQAGSEVGRSALASCITGFSFLTQLIFRSSRHDASRTSVPETEMKLDNMFTTPAEMMLPEPVEPPAVTLAEIQELGLPPAVSQLYGRPVMAASAA